MKNLILLSLFIVFFVSVFGWASDDHDKDRNHQEKTEEHGHEVDEPTTDKEEEHHDENEHGHEESSQVGPDKGILEADERHGIRLSPEAEKNFEIKRIKVASLPLTIGADVIVYSGQEENLFRYRQGFYKRIDFTVMSKSNGILTVQSQHLRPGDEVVTQGLGFLRIAEIAAFGGAAEGHSH